MVFLKDLAEKISDVSFDITIDTTSWDTELPKWTEVYEALYSSDAKFETYSEHFLTTNSSGTTFANASFAQITFTDTAKSATELVADFGGNFHGHAKSLLNDENRTATIAEAVGWFKSEDLGLLYKVLDDPQGFGIVTIKAGTYVEDVLLDTVPTYHACIVGALAIAKAPDKTSQTAIEDIANDITNKCNIALATLDMIINYGYLEEFKTEIQRQMVER